MHRFVLTIVAFAGFSLSAGAASAGPKINPGKWTYESTTKSAMMPQPKSETRTKCVSAEEAARDPLAAMLEGGRCKALDRKETGTSLTFEVECTSPKQSDAKMRGKGIFSGEGDTAAGSMNIEVRMPQVAGMPEMPQMPGGVMTMTTEWQGKRVGDCD